ncbi:lipase family protein [Phanerochaete sordida]|uniref:Lipase family protein n=1 Tax=Phanerochaete sordida TaxID=48140 RepID=A0A9P3GAH4_9APHY|nr:lipase family protein [Phanerochaete sordida]
MALLRGLLALVALLPAALAAPTLEARQSITALGASTISGFKPYTHYASTAYCAPANTLAWNCGANCQANPTFKPIASGGDGDGTQFWYAGWDPTLKTIIVAHQGTDTSEFLADLTDADIFRESLDSSLFPGISSSVTAHSGFADEQAKTAASVLAAVKTGISKYGAKKVTLVGHSLGAAIALLDAVYLPLHVSGVSFQTVLYGLPRVGNQDFADYVDAHVTSFTRINNEEDPIPIVPGRFLGFHHPSGEVHITDANVWEACPGQDNTSDLCIVGDVPNIFDGDESDHDGPYDGVEMGC